LGGWRSLAGNAKAGAKAEAIRNNKMPSDADKHIYACYVELENALVHRFGVDASSEIAGAINRLIDAHVQRAVKKARTHNL
jgi:hypothetical protein